MREGRGLPHETVQQVPGRTYRIHVVSELTGVPAATLRAWERRYGFPKPQRTGSRYRVYTEHDVAMVRRMTDLLQSGMAPSDAASLLLSESAASQSGAGVDEGGDVFQASVERLLAACRRMAVEALDHEVRHALTLGDATTIVERIFLPTMEAVGEQWECGEVSVAHEHMISETLCLAIRQLLRLMPVQQAPFRALLACVAGEQHVLPLYAVALRFAELGVRPELLGACTPPEAVAAAVQERSPDLVGLSLTMAPAAQGAVEMVTRYVQAVGKRPLLVGGAGAPAVAGAFERAGARVVRGGGIHVRAALSDTLSALRRTGLPR